MANPVVLSIEDDDGTYYLLDTAFREIDPSIRFLRVSDGEEAIAFLNRSGQYRDAARPDLILLNINLPKKTGPEVLSYIRQNESLSSIPAVVFTSSGLTSDKAKCLALGAEDYIVKPSTYAGLLDAIRSACARVPRTGQ